MGGRSLYVPALSRAVVLVVFVVLVLGASISSASATTSGVYAWGLNQSGQLGIGTHEGPESCFGGAPCSMVPVQVKGLTGSVTAVSAGYEHSLALLSNGTVMAW